MWLDFPLFLFFLELLHLFSVDLLQNTPGLSDILEAPLLLFSAFIFLELSILKGLILKKKIHVKEKPLHLMGVFLIGMAFGAGWSPCIGPMLGSILIVAGNQDTVLKGVSLLAVYSAGLAIPFIIISFFINSIIGIMKRATRFIGALNKASGILLIVIGLLLLFDKFRLLATL